MPARILQRSLVIGDLLALLAAGPLPAAAADTVKLAAITRTVFYVPLWVVMHRSFLTDEGLDVQVAFFDNARPNVFLRVDIGQSQGYVRGWMRPQRTLERVAFRWNWDTL